MIESCVRSVRANRLFLFLYGALFQSPAVESFRFGAVELVIASFKYPSKSLAGLADYSISC